MSTEIIIFIIFAGLSVIGMYTIVWLIEQLDKGIRWAVKKIKQKFKTL